MSRRRSAVTPPLPVSSERRGEETPVSRISPEPVSIATSSLSSSVPVTSPEPVSIESAGPRNRETSTAPFGVAMPFRSSTDQAGHSTALPTRVPSFHVSSRTGNPHNR